MKDPFAVVEGPLSLPPGSEDVDLRNEFTRLLLRCSKLENQLDSVRRDAAETEQKLLLGLLEVVDALDRILQRPSGTEDPNQALERQYHNVEATRRLLLQKLGQAGVKSVELLGMIADPTVVDLVGYQDNPDLPDETVVREIVKAYWCNKEMLRRGQVIVSRRL